ncbi:carbonic anhydrase 4-like isoform 1-T1 [Synchiropus picturatus]
MKLLTLLAVCALASSVFCANDGDWCYHDPRCNVATWPKNFTKFCNGSRQSPIKITKASSTIDLNLKNFTFTNYDSKTKFKKIMNTGKTVKVTLDSGVKISGGGLPAEYDALQFHLHWGNGTTAAGSEHTLDGKQFAMEMHIVHSKAAYNGNTTVAVADSEGLAALGFFIEESTTDETNSFDSWEKLTSFLTNILDAGSEHDISTSQISLDDLLGNVNRSKYFRYLGSLTTPACNEAVVWTVFEEPIKINKSSIDKFGTTVRIGDTDSDEMVNVYRNTQTNSLKVTYSGGSRNVAFPTCLVLLALLLAQLWA